ncbi:hypothetical protein GCM10010211_41280 [Streptomyces albospinus]|uniref:ATP-grasp domain-containing protein n=1 Tax=Streptomyces albospinus TaxID=285515 RepID=A0ABQ2V9K0_9ACTN|nr:alpha-L-glutamate ligase [Streptomyces albospinus]GGU71420.1 hypothetical protein GCM10010211_41280 [Streptomyces albospinus]
MICTDREHPVLAATAAVLRRAAHEVVFLDPEGEPPFPGHLADVYLLTAKTPNGLALAARLEAYGAPVINSPAATARCQDRGVLAEVARAAGLPYAATVRTGTLGELAAVADGPPVPGFPLVVKSRHSRRGNLVARVDGPARLAELAADRPEEPVIVQEFTANSGWDHKLWVVDGRLFAARRRSELAPGGRGENLPLPLADLPSGWTDTVRRVGEVFDLEVYGVDIVDAGGGTPLIVDINAFPGIRGQAGAPEALAALALRTAGAAGAAGGGPERRTRGDHGSS